MSKKKGLSLEEKRVRMLDLFHEKQEVFNLKELEKIAPVSKGITFKTVKEVVQSLVDDNLVESDKIGSSIYYWSFPSKAFTDKQKKLEDLQKKCDETEKKLTDVHKKLEVLKVEKKDTEERRQKAVKLAKLEKSIAEYSKYIEDNQHLDPDKLAEIKKESEVAKEAINRWTDNIFNIKSYAKRNMPCFDEESFNQSFGIPEDLDYEN
ncbi:meiotic nuclear division protein 1-like protein [Leptotrombidium deliense]|uniref:Meiotic nuclear division protein 1 homolog n=1 Tax=Leptotrombidium deliense TaxID=299467 RepID=A0A443S187_9ACAR|nr:meiotic nuclear division protein 1-like protein [Leptotrombidium deliense]